MICLNRGDGASELFQKKISKSEAIIRRNLNRLIPSNATHIFCNNKTTTYSLDQMCKFKSFVGKIDPGESKNCVLESREELNL